MQQSFHEKRYPWPRPERQAGGISVSGLMSNQLKLIAIIAMTWDHAVTLFVPHTSPYYLLLHIPGRLAAPFMCFLVAEGYHHTSNLTKYLGRLLLFAIISHVPYNLCFRFSPLEFWRSTSVIWSLFMGLAALTIAEHSRLPTALKISLIVFCCMLTRSADWNYIAVLMILAFGIFRDEPVKRTIAHLTIGVLYVAQGAYYGLSMVPRLGIFLSVPLLLLYNGQRGRKSKALQWGFYWFYPLHLLLLYALCLAPWF